MPLQFLFQAWKQIAKADFSERKVLEVVTEGTGNRTSRIQNGVHRRMPERVIALSEDSKERISEWLVSLDLGHLVVNPSGDFTGDKLRNGVVLCELAGLIEGSGSFVRHYEPKSVTGGREI